MRKKYDFSTFCSNFAVESWSVSVESATFIPEIELFDLSSSSIFLYSNLIKYLSMKVWLNLVIVVGGLGGRCSGCAGRMSMGIGQRKDLE